MKFNGVEIEFDDPEERKRWGMFVGGVFFPPPATDILIIESTAYGLNEFKKYADERAAKKDWDWHG